MNLTDTLKIFSVIKANYGNFFKNMSKVDAEAMVNLWHEMFADVPYEVVGVAVKTYIATDTTGYPPNVGQINEQIRTLTQQEQMTEQEASSLMMKAIRNGLYGAKEEFEKLPPILKRLAGSPEQLRVWASMGEDEVQTVVASNLMRSYRAIAKKQEVQQTLPSSIKALLEQASDKFRIESN